MFDFPSVRQGDDTDTGTDRALFAATRNSGYATTCNGCGEYARCMSDTTTSSDIVKCVQSKGTPDDWAMQSYFPVLLEAFDRGSLANFTAFIFFMRGVGADTTALAKAAHTVLAGLRKGLA